MRLLDTQSASPDEVAAALAATSILDQEEAEKAARAIVAEVRAGGDAAVRDCHRRYDGADLGELAVPPRVAGVEEIIVCSPPRSDGGVDPVMLAAADVAGVDRFFRIGGAQGVAAMAYGTESVPRVDKIVGPGNLYTVMAKRAVFGVVDVESLPGPTEIVVVADESADPRWVAADIL